MAQPLNKPIWQEACFIFEEQNQIGYIFAGWPCCFSPPNIHPFILDHHISPLFWISLFMS